MRSGFTTGTCAAAAAGAAVLACLSKEFPAVYCVVTPKGTVARLEIHAVAAEAGYAVCGVYKDSGDDPDVTNGAWVETAVYTKVSEESIEKIEWTEKKHRKAENDREFEEDKKADSDKKPDMDEADSDKETDMDEADSDKETDMDEADSDKETDMDEADSDREADVGKEIENTGKDRFEEKKKEVLEHGYWYQTERGAWIGIAGGTGIGTVTKRGLSCPPGRAAINPVPREMIFKEVQRNLEKYGQDQQGEEIIVEVRIPQGVELAEKTFNPKLGIVGGISVLGTSGVVEPMSEEALVASIQLELHIKAVEGRKFLVLTPGNYGERFIQEEFGFSLKEAVKCSNFIGTSVQSAQREGFLGILLVGHLGKLIKVSLGVMNTHSKYGDRRIEGFLSAMRGCGITAENGFGDVWEKISASNTSEEAVGFLQDAGILECVMREIVKKIQAQLSKELQTADLSNVSTLSGTSADGTAGTQIEVVVFSSVLGLVGKTEGAMQMAEKIRMQEEIR